MQQFSIMMLCPCDNQHSCVGEHILSGTAVCLISRCQAEYSRWAQPQGNRKRQCGRTHGVAYPGKHIPGLVRGLSLKPSVY